MVLPETIFAEGVILCHVIHTGTLPDVTTFSTAPGDAMQVGHIVHPRGHEIARHAHRLAGKHISGTGEVLLVRRGRCEIDIYDDQRRLVATRELRVGDIVVLLGGGHGFRMLEDTVLLEVKQGPYPGLGEKEQF